MKGGNHLERLFREVARPVVARGSEYPDGHVIAPHCHSRGQLLYGMTGAVGVSTVQGAWIMPPQRGLWIPSGVEHEVRMWGAVSMRSLYFEPDVVSFMPERCEVVVISPLTRSLLAAIVQAPAAYDVGSRGEALITLILHEMRLMHPLPLSLPLPHHTALLRRCRKFLANPSTRPTIDDWSAAMGMTRRSFTRLFRQEVGLSFVAWRQQACLMAALPRLAAGHPITTIAIDLGYNNPAAFTTMFRRVLGASPSAFRQGGETLS